MNTTHIPHQPVTIHEQRVDTYIENGPQVVKERHWGQDPITLHTSRVVTTYRTRDVGDRVGNIETEQRVYGRTTLKDGTPSNVESSIKERDWTPELAGLLAQIADDNFPEAGADNDECQCSDPFTASLTGHGHGCPEYSA